ncbi:MAG: hypothetical protein COB50_01260 [Thiotrichales bacterium]|nr:MAG: hypothetical protein COB50_01260 [Thiotrichales bacterium]
MKKTVENKNGNFKDFYASFIQSTDKKSFLEKQPESKSFKNNKLIMELFQSKQQALENEAAAEVEHIETAKFRKQLHDFYNGKSLYIQKEASTALKALMAAIFLLVGFTFFCSVYGYISSMTPIFWIAMLFASFSMLTNAVFFTKSVPDFFAVLPKNLISTWKNIGNSNNTKLNNFIKKAAFVLLFLTIVALCLFFAMGLTATLTKGLAHSPIAGASLAWLRWSLAGIVAALFSVKTFNALQFDLILPSFKWTQNKYLLSIGKKERALPEYRYSYWNGKKDTPITTEADLIKRIKDDKCEIFVNGKRIKHRWLRENDKTLPTLYFTKSELDGVNQQKWRLHVKYLLTVLLSIGFFILLTLCSIDAITAVVHNLSSGFAKEVLGVMLPFAVIGTITTQAGFLLKQTIKMHSQLARFVTWLMFTVTKALFYIPAAIWNHFMKSEGAFSQTYKDTFSESDYKTLKLFFGSITIIPLILMVLITIGNAAANLAIAKQGETIENRIASAAISFLSCAPASMELALEHTFTSIGVICALPTMASIIAIALLGANASWLIPGLLPVVLLGVWIATVQKKKSVSATSGNTNENLYHNSNNTNAPGNQDGNVAMDILNK